MDQPNPCPCPHCQKIHPSNRNCHHQPFFNRRIRRGALVDIRNLFLDDLCRLISQDSYPLPQLRILYLIFREVSVLEQTVMKWIRLYCSECTAKALQLMENRDEYLSLRRINPIISRERVFPDIYKSHRIDITFPPECFAAVARCSIATKNMFPYMSKSISLAISERPQINFLCMNLFPEGDNYRISDIYMYQDDTVFDRVDGMQRPSYILTDEMSSLFSYLIAKKLRIKFEFGFDPKFDPKIFKYD